MSYASHVMRILRCIGLIAGFAIGALSHAADSRTTDARIDRLIEVSGIANSARQLPPSIAGGFDDPQAGLPDEVRAALREAALLSFKADPIIERVRKALAATLTGRRLDETLAWFDSPLGRRITDLENAASDPAANERIVAYAKTVKEHPPTKQRSVLIEKINVATESGELNAMILETSYLASALGINAALPAENRQSVEAVRRRVKAADADLRAQSDNAMTMTMLYTYQSLSDKELQSYLAFLKTPGGAAYSRASALGVRETMLEQMGHFMQAIPKAIAGQKDRVNT